MKKIKVMAMRPTIFEIETDTFANAKQIVIDNLIASRQLKPTEPIEFREIIEIEIDDSTNNQDNSNPSKE